MSFTGILFSQDKEEIQNVYGADSAADVNYISDIIYKNNGSFFTAPFGFNEETNPFEIKTYSKSNPDIWMKVKVIGAINYECLNDPSTKMAFGFIRTNRRGSGYDGNSWYRKMYTKKPGSSYEYGTYYESSSGRTERMRGNVFISATAGETDAAFSMLSRFENQTFKDLCASVKDWVYEFPLPVLSIFSVNPPSGFDFWKFGMSYQNYWTESQPTGIFGWTYPFLTEWDSIQSIPKDTVPFQYFNRSVYFGYNPYETSSEFDLFYRAKYGAEFPWEDQPDPPVIAITSTESHAGSPDNPSKNIQPISQTVYDTVNIVNLIPGIDFELGILVADRETEEFLGDPVYFLFTATESVMSINVPVTIDTTDLEGHKLVFLTYLLYEGEVIAAHDDPLDEHEFLYVQSEEEEDDEDDEEYGDYSSYAVDSSFNNIGPIENYNSLIWTDRYSKCGDFEIHAPYDSYLFNTLQVDNYIFIPESQRYMVIEKVEITSTTSEGTKMVISGRSLESILDRRVIWNKTTIDGPLEEGIHRLLNENVISPDAPTIELGKRRISNFIFKNSNDPEIEALELFSQYIGDNLYDVISEICESHNIGFKITLDSQNNFIFQLYKGKDRSYRNPNNNKVVIFSPDFGNMVDCDYVKSKEKMKNVCRIAGEGDGDEQIFSYFSKDKKGGLYRRETYISATELSREYTDNMGEPAEMTKAQYMEALAQRGREEIANSGMALAIDGTMYTTANGAEFTYEEDFDLGDIIECDDTVGNSMKAKITEVIITKDSSGYTVYPTFESIDDELVLIFGRMSTYADNANQPFTNSILLSEYFTYNPSNCTYTCHKDTGKCELRMDWKWGKYPDDTKKDSIIDVVKNDESFYHFEIPNWVDGSRTIDISFKAGDTFYLHKEQHGNAYFTAMKVVKIEEV